MEFNDLSDLEVSYIRAYYDLICNATKRYIKSQVRIACDEQEAISFQRNSDKDDMLITLTHYVIVYNNGVEIEVDFKSDQVRVS